MIDDRGQAITARLEREVARALEALPDNRAKVVEVLSRYPDLLTPINEHRSETCHTRALSYFLGQRFPHAQDCAAAIMRVALNRHPPAEHRLDAKQTKAELYVPDVGRLDVFFRYGPWHVVIEAKIDAAEGEGQREKYADWLDRIGGKRGLLIYLTPEDRQEPQANTSAASPKIAKVTYRELTFTQLLREWLFVAARQVDPLAEYLGAYLKSVAMHLCGKPLAEHGNFGDWSVATRLALVDLLKSQSECRA